MVDKGFLAQQILQLNLEVMRKLIFKKLINIVIFDLCIDILVHMNRNIYAVEINQM
jgi:hypothetical protein